MKGFKVSIAMGCVFAFFFEHLCLMAISKYQILGYLEHLKSDQLRGFGFLFICFLIIFTLSGMLELTFSVYINVCALMGHEGMGRQVISYYKISEKYPKKEVVVTGKL